MKASRAYRNIISNFAVQIISTIAGIIIPKLIIIQYGSTINGMVGSVGQFLMYAGLVEAGIGNASIVALYKPLTEKSWNDVNVILSEANRKYRKSGFSYILITLLIACIYPFFVSDQIDYSFAFNMTILLSLMGVIDYFLIGKYKVLLTADNKYYILNFAKMLENCILACGSIFLLINGFSLLIVKGFAVVTHIGEAICLKTYVHFRYQNIEFKSIQRVELKQQKSALLHQICMVITYNTDLIVLTLLLKGNSLSEISVYSVYSLILSFAKNFISSLCVGLSASFGKLYVKKEMEKLQKAFSRYELIYVICLFAFYTCIMALILPFIRCYVGNVTDTNYVRVKIAVLFTLTGVFSQLKDAHGTLVNGGCGAYKETQKYAICEAVVNIGISVFLVRKLGIEGVLIGTVISHLLMDYGIIKYTYKEVLPQIKKRSEARIMRNFIFFIIMSYIDVGVCISIEQWNVWIIAAVIITLINSIIFFLFNYAFERQELIAALTLENLKKKEHHR